MTKPRIHIIGGPGSGKSFVAAELSRRLGVPAYDLDDLFWNRSASRYGVRADVDERDRRLVAIVAQDGWVIEGVYYGWLVPSFDAADMIIELSPSIWVRHWRVIRRFVFRQFRRNASKRESVADLWRLLRWSHSYDRRHLREARTQIAARGRQVVACRTLEQVFAATSDLQRAATDPQDARCRSALACGRTKEPRGLVECRPATRGDADFVADVYLRSRKELLACAPLAHSDDEVREWIRRLLIPAGRTTVALVDARVVGFMAVSRGSDGSWIDQLYLLPEWVERGIGTRLVELAQSELPPPIRLYSFQCNERARRFYERRGFQAIAFGDGSRNEENCPDILFEWAPVR